MATECERAAREAQVALLNLLNKGHLYDSEERAVKAALGVARDVESRES